MKQNLIKIVLTTINTLSINQIDQIIGKINKYSMDGHFSKFYHLLNQELFMDRSMHKFKKMKGDFCQKVFILFIFSLIY